jgi:hypothetical protein
MSLLNHPIVAPPPPTIVIMIDIESPSDYETVVSDREEKMRMEGQGRIEGRDAEMEDDEFVAVVRERLVKAKNWAFQ